MTAQISDPRRASGKTDGSSATSIAKSATPESRSASKRYMSLDHWRGIACLIVVMTHATGPMCYVEKPAPGTPVVHVSQDQTSDAASRTHAEPTVINKIAKLLVWATTKMHFGVEMFFVISGYCITASAESLRRSGNKASEYFRRRFVRIYPPFWSIFALSAAFCFACDAVAPGFLGRGPWVVAMPWDLSVWQLLGSLTLSGTWIGAVTGQEALCFPHQSWTLSYEEQFYAVIGIVCALSGRRFFQAVSLVTAVIAAVDLTSLYFPLPVKGFFFDEHWFMFAAGVAVYWVLNCATTRQSLIFKAGLISVITGLALTTYTFGSGTQFNAWRLVGALVFSGVLIGLKQFDEQIMQIRSLKWLSSCGVMCYSVYLVHLFPGKLISENLIAAGFTDDLSIVLICIPTVLAASVSLGYLFHVSVEKHFLNTPRKLIPTPVPLAASESVAIPFSPQPNPVPAFASQSGKAA